MERLKQHLDTLRAKPEHVRHRIAFGTAFAVTGVVALAWMATMASSGVLALREEAPAAPPDEIDAALAESTSAFSNLVGAAGAAFGAGSPEAALKIIEERTTSTLDDAPPGNDTQETVIPF